MKKVLLLALVATIAFTGCKKDDDDAPSYTADATINGVKTTFNSIQFYTLSTVYFVFNYEDVDNEYVMTLISPKVGTMDFSEGGNTMTLTIGGVTYNSKAAAGTITITTKDDKTLSGTYTGTFVKEGTTTTVSITGAFSAAVTTATAE
jgi:hypothetical protein